MKRVLVALLILGGSIILIGVNFGRFMQAHGRQQRDKVEERITRTFDVEAGGLLSVDIDGGSIDVQPSDSRKVSIEMYRSIEARNADEARKLLERYPMRFNQSGNTVYIESEGPDGKYNKQVKLRITVPRNFNVDLKTSGGNLTVERLAGTIRGKTSGGNLRFLQIEGPVRGETSGGSITAKEIEGEVVIKTSGGPIDVSNVSNDVVAHTSGGSITAKRIDGKLDARTSGGTLNFEDITGEIEGHSSGGSVTARFAKPLEANCRLETSGGSVNVFLPENSQFDLDAEAGSGQIVTEFPVSITLQGKLEKSVLRGSVNGGGHILYCRTSGSNINLKKIAATVSFLIPATERSVCVN
jgi:hypothetical protein